MPAPQVFSIHTHEKNSEPSCGALKNKLDVAPIMDSTNKYQSEEYGYSLVKTQGKLMLTLKWVLPVDN